MFCDLHPILRVTEEGTGAGKPQQASPSLSRTGSQFQGVGSVAAGGAKPAVKPSVSQSVRDVNKGGAGAAAGGGGASLARGSTYLNATH
jgi:hypothetical protein